jgi:hypothetical protein
MRPDTPGLRQAARVLRSSPQDPYRIARESAQLGGGLRDLRLTHGAPVPTVCVLLGPSTSLAFVRSRGSWATGERGFDILRAGSARCEIMRAVMNRRRARLTAAAPLVIATACGAPLDVPNAGTPVDERLEPNATGWIDRSVTGTTGIQGQWRAWESNERAATVPDDFCANAGFGECSVVEEPAPGEPYAPTLGLGMCTSGVIARWLFGSDGVTPDGSPGWAGNVLVFDAPYDATLHGVTGLAFDLASEPLPGSEFLVQLTSVAPPTSGAEHTVSYWGGTRSESSPAHAGHNEFEWEDVGPKPFDPTRLVSVAFLVAGNHAHAASYDFCVDNLTARRGAQPVPGVSRRQPLEPDSTGWIDRSTTGTTMIQGIWFGAADGDEGGACPRAGHPPSDCSQVIGREPNGSVAPTPDLGICIAGMLPKLPAATDGNLDVSNVWGAMLGLNFNEASAPEHGVAPYDADRYGVTGFAFDLDSEPPLGAEIRVQIADQAAPEEAPWWGGGSAEFSPVHAGHNEFRFEEVGGPTWITDPEALDTSGLFQIGFHVVPNETREVSFRFCIANLTALQE